MSILPYQIKASTSSSSSAQLFLPESNHGILSSSSPPPSSLPDSTPPPRRLSGEDVPASGCSADCSKEVKGRERQIPGKSPIHQNVGKALQPKAGSWAGVRSSEHHDKSSEKSVTPRDHQGAASTSSLRGTGHSSGRKSHMVDDGQHLILHPFNMKCLLHHYGSYERLPNRITGKILQMETISQSDAMRRRYRFLSHFSLTTTFQLCEIDMSEILPPESLFPFTDEMKNREKLRKRIARKELEDKIEAETAGSQFLPMPCSSFDASPSTSFSVDDFEALGGHSAASSSPPTFGDRPSFLGVTRLGFTAAHDSPALKAEEILPSSHAKINLPSSTGLSFANVTSRTKPVEGLDISKKANEAGKKGKRPMRVLLSTAGGRRY